MIFVQIYIKILGFGQKSILMRVDLFEIFLSETSEICLFFDISLVFDRKCWLFLFSKRWWAFTLHCGSLFYIKIPTPQVVPLFRVYPFDLLDFHKKDKH